MKIINCKVTFKFNKSKIFIHEALTLFRGLNIKEDVSDKQNEKIYGEKVKKWHNLYLHVFQSFKYS